MAIHLERKGLQRITVAHHCGARRPAYVLTQLMGSVAIGDDVVVNTTAVELGLGTGGWDVVHWNLARSAWSEQGQGHVMKLRYTSLQVDTGVAEEAPGYVPPEDLGGAPVVACGLHSQVACVAAVIKSLAPTRRVVYVMTDGAALPLALSDLVADCSAAGLLDATVTAGQAFGGDYEAVNVASALDVARGLAGADAVVVAGGPGGVGTSSRHGFSALEVAGVVDAAGRACGRPIVALRYSDVDPRPRHRGLSHHSLAALAHAHQIAAVAAPKGEPVWTFSHPALSRHQLIEVDVPDVASLFVARGISVSTMGRGPREDPRFFTYSGAAGALAARLLGARG